MKKLIAWIRIKLGRILGRTAMSILGRNGKFDIIVKPVIVKPEKKEKISNEELKRIEQKWNAYLRSSS